MKKATADVSATDISWSTDFNFFQFTGHLLRMRKTLSVFNVGFYYLKLSKALFYLDPPQNFCGKYLSPFALVCHRIPAGNHCATMMWAFYR